ncbi:MAG: RIO1 family regulatory kinase/ATPase [Candidatus Micrarchaeia archaeon]
MARRISKRKRPLREFYVLSERWKIEDSVFDKFVLLTISKLMKKNLIRSVDFPISRGKEANVYRATDSEGNLLALKIYRIETTQFFKKMKYIEGDPRFSKIKRDRKNLAFIFAKKEFRNLMMCDKIGINCPKAYICIRNVLLMDFLGIESKVYPQLFRAKRELKYLKQILNQIKLMYSNGFVHADLSPYNILVGDKVYLIDFGQGVIKDHPYFERFLERDVLNILSFFGKEKELEKTLNWIKN